MSFGELTSGAIPLRVIQEDGMIVSVSPGGPFGLKIATQSPDWRERWMRGRTGEGALWKNNQGTEGEKNYYDEALFRAPITAETKSSGSVPEISTPGRR